MKSTASYDLLVIGGGSGGHAAAKTAAGLGLRTALVDSAEILGGLCVLRGCMPSKTLIETANRMRAIRDAARFGIRIGTPELDADALRSRVERLVEDFRSSREKGMTSGLYELLRGSARFISPHEVEVIAKDGSRSVLGASTFVIATGSRPSPPPEVPGLVDTPYWTSDDVVRLPFLPRRLAVVGAGAIGMECAHLFEGLGSQVTVIARGPSIMGEMDPEISAVLEAESVERGIRFLKETKLASVSHEGGIFHLRFDGETPPLEADALLIATGRTPATAGLGLQSIGVAMEKGRILIDERSSTSISHIFAAGDCASPVPVVHLAVIQGEVAARNAARVIRGDHFGAASEWNRESAMTGWFTEPQCAQIGLTTKAAAEKGIPVLSGECRYTEQGKGLIVGARCGFVKVIADPETGRLLGAAAVGPEVVETAHILQAAIELRLTAAGYLAIPHYHPTLAEAWSRAVAEIAAQMPGS